MSKAFKQADREAYITLGLYVFFFLWWTLFAFGLGSGDPEEYSYVWGPSYLLLSPASPVCLIDSPSWLSLSRFKAL